MSKKNCWEYKKCGREPEGANVHELGVCPTSTATRLDGIHGGKNGGRVCWAIAGSMCDGEVQGTYEQKYGECIICDFYHSVKREETDNFL
jgi:hypothetical protein